MPKIGVLDLETDPFKHGRVPVPFVAAFMSEDTYVSFWGSDCITKMVAYLAGLPEKHVIYAHNGGKFDYFYFLEHIRAGLQIVNGRIIKCSLGIHELRDSYAILPFSLATYGKDDIDYEKMEPHLRELHRQEILDYLHTDCEKLLELVTAFWAEFGDCLTVGGTAMKQIKKFHEFKSGNSAYDGKFRPYYYYGGRNQCFAGGVIKQTCNIYDVNSMYPFVMATYKHPISTGHTISKRVGPETCFITAEGHNYGAFPQRQKDNSLAFNIPFGTFHVTIHEWNAAIETGTFKPTRIIKAYDFIARDTFALFVNHFYSARKACNVSGDKIHALFYKYILNSGYGKFAQNPENYKEWHITGMEIMPPPWEPTFICEQKYIIWSKPAAESRYYNICTGASITGGSRALLLRGICGATKPIYCDTDSIICDSLSGVPLSEVDLGSWKLEGTGDTAYIGGKKLYAIMAGETCIKKAHKGARLTAAQIQSIACGAVVNYANPVPNYKLGAKVGGDDWTVPMLEKQHTFVTRRIRRTV